MYAPIIQVRLNVVDLFRATEEVLVMAEKSLHERLGGVFAIAAVAD